MQQSFRIAALAAALCLAASGAVKVEKVSYKGWPNSYRVSNGEVELIVTGDVGPRIMRFGFVGGQNVLKEFEEQLGKSGEEKFQLRGGHRVWKAPEDPVATWAPDNVPVTVTVTADGLTAREPVEPLTGLQKEISVEMAATGSGVDGEPPHPEQIAVPARVRAVGADHDGAGRGGASRAFRRAASIRRCWRPPTRWSCGPTRTCPISAGPSRRNT